VSKIWYTDDAALVTEPRWW